MNKRRVWAFIVLLGVIIGTILLNLSLSFYGTALKEQMEQFHRMARNQLEPGTRLFLRICFYRLGASLILFFCIRFMGNYYVFYPFVMILSIGFGYTLSLLSFCYGFKGIIYMFAYLWPQYFIYIPLMIGILREASSQMDRVFLPNMRRTVVIFTIIFLGCGAESYINPWILKIILKNFR